MTRNKNQHICVNSDYYKKRANVFHMTNDNALTVAQLSLDKVTALFKRQYTQVLMNRIPAVVLSHHL